MKQWLDSDAAPEAERPTPKEGEYIHVWGRLKDFNGKRHIGSHVIRPVTDFNEISYHLLEATAVHLYFTRGPPESLDQNGNIKTEGMFVNDEYGGGATNGNVSGGRVLSAKISGNGRKVFNLLNSTPQNNEGINVHVIAQELQMPVNDVFKAGDELLQDGLIYTTVDDETWAILEYN